MNTLTAKSDNLPVLLKLAGPIALSQVAQTSMGFVDTVFVGRLGATSLAAISLGSMIHFTALLLCLGTVLAVGPLVSQAVGAQNEVEIRRYTRQGLWLASFLTPLVMLVDWSAVYWLQRLQQPPEVIAITGEYMRAVSWSVFPFLAFGAIRSWLEALNRPLPVTFIAVSAVLVNLLGNYVFIYGHFGVPAFGAVGAGYATALSYFYMLSAIVAYALNVETLRKYKVFDKWRAPDSTYLWNLFKVGAPMGVTFGIESGLFMITAILIGQLGTIPLAAHQIALQLASLSFMIPLSIALASTIRVGNLIGAGAYASAKHAGWLSIGLGALVMCASAIVFVAFPEMLIELFLGEKAATSEIDVAVLAVKLLALAALFQLVDGIQATAGGSLRGLKDTFWPMVIGLISYWAIGLSVGYSLSLKHGAEGLWIGLVVGLAVAAVLLVGRWNRLINKLLVQDEKIAS